MGSTNPDSPLGQYLNIDLSKDDVIVGENIIIDVQAVGFTPDSITIFILPNTNPEYSTNESTASFTKTFSQAGTYTIYVEAYQGAAGYTNERSVYVKDFSNLKIGNKQVSFLKLGNKVIKNIRKNGLNIYDSSVETWEPELNGETGASYTYSYNEQNGEGVGKGFILNNGFPNDENWELNFEFKHDNIQYTGICFLAELGKYSGNGGSNYALTTWEGSWPNGTRYANYTSGAVGWFDVKVTKIDSTHVNIKSSILDRNTDVEVLWLEDAQYLSCGARHNDAGSGFGPCRIRNVQAIYGF